MNEKIRTATVRDIDQYLSDDAEVCAWEDVKNVLDAKNKSLELAKVLVKIDAETIQNKDKEIAELKKKLEDAQATAYTESVDEGMHERKLCKALWIARANRALEKIAWFKLWNASISTMNPEDGARQEFDKWKKALGKFLSQVERYK